MFLHIQICLGNNRHGKYFGLTFRYIDDLLSIYNKYCRQHISSIHPHNLELKKTTENNLEC